MKKVFHPNTKWNNAYLFTFVNTLFAFVLLFILSFYVSNMPVWLQIIIIPLFFFILYALVKDLISTPAKLELDSSAFVFYFHFNKIRKYSFNDIRYYATATYGNSRGGLFHSVVLEFLDGNRIQIPSVKFDNYLEFLQFMRNSSFEFFGFIDQKNWRNKNKPLSKKWVVARNEIELEAKIGKKNDLFFLYFMSACIFILNVTMLYLTIVLY